MATLQDSHDSTGGANPYSVYGVNKVGMTFTAGDNYAIESVEIYAKREGAAPGNAVLSLYATSGGLPTGEALKNIGAGANGWSTSYAWRTFAFASTVDLTKDTMYALVLEVATGDETNSVEWESTLLNQYAGGGALLWVVDAWDSFPDEDLGFKTYGEAIYTFTPPPGGPTKKRLVAAAASALWFEDVT